MKNKLIDEIKELAREISNSEAENLSVYKQMLSKLNDKITVFQYLEAQIEALEVETFEKEPEVVENIQAITPEKVAVSDSLSQLSKAIQDAEPEIDNHPAQDKGQYQQEVAIEDKDFDSKVKTQKSLNEEFKKTAKSIGLNDKILFVKKLFDGSQNDYNRVISQVNTFETLQELRDFINTYVRPDYNWDANPEIADKFIGLIEEKFL